MLFLNTQTFICRSQLKARHYLGKVVMILPIFGLSFPINCNVLFPM